MSTGARPRRAAVALFVAALLVSMRVLSPPGFMPSFDRGSVTIVACPDAFAAPPAGHHHGEKKSAHERCPYAAASALDGVASLADLIAAVALFGAALLSGRPFASVVRLSRRERPPLRGPPILA